jgi:YfiH family protein
MNTRELNMDRRTMPGGIIVLVPPDLEAAGFAVAFTERGGGVSTGSFRSLNLGLRSGDDPALVAENRGRLSAALGIDRFACAQQVHGARIHRVGWKDAGSGYRDPAESFRGVDALLTDERDLALAVLTADCVPVVLADPGFGRLAVIHAGWRGTAAGILVEALGVFDDPAAVMAAIGPAVGPDHYEVGEDVAAAVSAACPSGAVTTRDGSRLYLDLPASIGAILEGAGVRRISRTEVCTACEPDRFFSYRRDGSAGRQGVVAVRAG